MKVESIDHVVLTVQNRKHLRVLLASARHEGHDVRGRKKGSIVRGPEDQFARIRK